MNEYSWPRVLRGFFYIAGLIFWIVLLTSRRIYPARSMEVKPPRERRRRRLFLIKR